jgi:hypothetical protein
MLSRSAQIAHAGRNAEKIVADQVLLGYLVVISNLGRKGYVKSASPREIRH